MPSVSVIIPVFNSENFIGEAIESVFSQTFTDYELILIDDGSTDKTGEAINRYAKNRKLRYVRQPNRGPAASRNFGIGLARAKYCAFLDSDDLMLPDRLLLQLEALHGNEKAGLVYSDLMTFDAKGIVHSSKKEFSWPYSGWVLDKLLLSNFITTSTVMVRKDSISKVGVFDEGKRLSEDYEMWLKISKEFMIEYIDLPLVKYRYHESSLSKDRVAINFSGYEVVKEFWEKNQELKKENNRLYRKSMGSQLSNIAAAYFYSDNFGASLAWSLDAIRQDHYSRVLWSLFLKGVLASLRLWWRVKYRESWED